MPNASGAGAKPPIRSHLGKGARWLLGTLVVAVIGGLAAAYFTGDLSTFLAKRSQPDSVRRVVNDFLAEVRRGDPKAASRLTGKAKTIQWNAWDPARDPVVWVSRVSIGVSIKTADSAHAYAKAPEWGFRRAEAGCRELDEAFHLVRRDGQWLVDELPRLRALCSDSLLAASWASYEPKGVQRWQRKDLQRVDVLRPKESTSRVNQGAARTVDIGRGPSLAPKVSTAYLTHRGKWPNATLHYTFKKRVALVRIRFHNGVRSSYREHGRIRRAVVTAGDRTVEVSFPDRNARFRLDCDFGTVGRVAIRITDIYPAQTPPTDSAQTVAPTHWAFVDATKSDVALSHVDFWARIADEGQVEPAGPYAFAADPNLPRDKEVVASCGRQPIPPEATAPPAPPPATPAPSLQPGPLPATQTAPPPNAATPEPQTQPQPPPVSVPAVGTTQP